MSDKNVGVTKEETIEIPITCEKHRAPCIGYSKINRDACEMMGVLEIV